MSPEPKPAQNMFHTAQMFALFFLCLRGVIVFWYSQLRPEEFEVARALESELAKLSKQMAAQARVVGCWLLRNDGGVLRFWIFWGGAMLGNKYVEHGLHMGFMIIHPRWCRISFHQHESL